MHIGQENFSSSSRDVLTNILRLDDDTEYLQQGNLGEGGAFKWQARRAFDYAYSGLPGGIKEAFF